MFSRFEGTDGIAEPDETEPQQEFSQEESQKLSWHVVHDADDEYGNPTQWSATLSEGIFLWIDKEVDGYAIYDTADTTRPALETFSTLQEAMDWGNELAESGREAETEFSDEREQTEDELDNIDTQAARERLENGEAEQETEDMLSQVLTGDWEPLTPSSEENSLHQKGNQHKKGRYQHQIKVTLSISISAMTDWVKALQKKNSRQILQQSNCWSRSRAKVDMQHRKNSRFCHSMSVGVVLLMRLTRANQTGQQNITS